MPQALQGLQAAERCDDSDEREKADGSENGFTGLPHKR